MRKRGRQASPVAPGPCPDGAAVAEGAEEMVRRSRIAACVTCGLCGGFLRDAAAIPDCLHAFCRECIVEEFTDKDINRCPKCEIDLGCNPLKNLRADHSLQHIRSLIFPAKKRKMEEISSPQPPFVPLPSPSNQADGVDHSAKKAYAHVMGEPMNVETETEADERLGMEPSSPLEKFVASTAHTAVVAPGAEPTWLDDCGSRQRDEQREEASSTFSVVEPQGAIEGSGIEEFESENHGLLVLDKQVATQERNELTDEGDPWIVAVERSKTRMTTEERNELTDKVDPWIVAVERSKTRMTTEARNELRDEVDPWIVAVERSTTRMTAMAANAFLKTKLQEAKGIFNAIDTGIHAMHDHMEVLGRQAAAERANATAAVKEADEARALARAEREQVSSLTTQVQAERARAQSLEDQVGRLRRELEAARAGATEADARRYVADQKMEAERAAEMMRHAFDRVRDNLEGYGLRPADPPDRSVAGYATAFGCVGDCLDRLRDAIVHQCEENARAAAAATAEYVLACCLSRDPSFRMEVVLEGIVAADEVEANVLRGRARETALRFAQEAVRVDAPPQAGDGAGGNKSA